MSCATARRYFLRRPWSRGPGWRRRPAFHRDRSTGVSASFRSRKCRCCPKAAPGKAGIAATPSEKHATRPRAPRACPIAPGDRHTPRAVAARAAHPAARQCSPSRPDPRAHRPPSCAVASENTAAPGCQSLRQSVWWHTRALFPRNENRSRQTHTAIPAKRCFPEPTRPSRRARRPRSHHRAGLVSAFRVSQSFVAKPRAIPAPRQVGAGLSLRLPRQSWIRREPSADWEEAEVERTR